MRRLLLILVLSLMWHVPGTRVQAQTPVPTYAQLHGVWIHADFIDGLRDSASVVAALRRLLPHQPLWLQIDSAQQDGRIQIAYGLSDTVPWLLRRVPTSDGTVRWAIGPEAGDDAGPEWFVTADLDGASYVALSPFNQPSAKPVVYGALPSKRQDALYMIHRMVNATMIAGSYTDATGGRYEFTPTMTGSWKGARIRSTLAIDPKTYSVLLTIEFANRHRETYTVERRGPSLYLRTATQEIVLRPSKKS